MMYQDNFFSSIYKLLATKTDGRRSTYLQFEEDRRGLDPFFVEESGGRTVDVQGSCRLEESGSRGECRSGGATSAQEGEERRRREEWRRRVAQGVQIRREATSRSRGKKPHESAADQGSCRGMRWRWRRRRCRPISHPPSPSPHHHVRGALSGGRPRKRMRPNHSERKEQGVAHWSIAR